MILSHAVLRDFLKANETKKVVEDECISLKIFALIEIENKFSCLSNLTSIDLKANEITQIEKGNR